MQENAGAQVAFPTSAHIPLQRETAIPEAITSRMAVWSFISAFLFALLGVILGLVALSKIKESNGRLKGQPWAVAGVVVGILNMIAYVVIYG
jgi:hypothetical protein